MSAQPALLDVPDWALWFYDPGAPLWQIAASATMILVILGTATRLGRLRSLAQMSGFDFGVNVAIGSVLAAVIVNESPSLVQGAVAVAAIFVFQTVYSELQSRVPGRFKPSSQPPYLVMLGPDILEDNLSATGFTRAEVHQAIRRAGLVHLEQVRMVVAEPTGTLTVYDQSDHPVSRELFQYVVGSERILPSQTPLA